MENLPLVSVIVPTYNGEKYVKEALCSVLKQDYPNMEILTIDDCSKDHTPDILKHIKQELDTKDQIKIILDKKNKWIPRNMNLWLNESNGKYVAVLDQDDFWIDESKLSKQVDFLESNRDFGLVWTNVIIDRMWEKIENKLPSSDENIRKIILWLCCFQHSSVMYQKSLAIDVWWYSLEYKYTMDYKLFLDLMKEAKASNISDITTYYRLHWNNVSMKYTCDQRKEALNIYREYKDYFPEAMKALILRIGLFATSKIFSGNSTYEKLKLSIKNFYQS